MQKMFPSHSTCLVQELQQLSLCNGATTGAFSCKEREMHELTHMPLRSWCDICFRAKSRVNYGKEDLRSRKIIEMD
eukprot:1158675-Amphidinium_carterae.2